MERLHLGHSQHWRLLQDLPVQSIPMIMMLRRGRWRCRHAGCERRISTKRLFQGLCPVCTTGQRDTPTPPYLQLTARQLGDLAPEIPSAVRDGSRFQHAHLPFPHLRPSRPPKRRSPAPNTQ